MPDLSRRQILLGTAAGATGLGATGHLMVYRPDIQLEELKQKYTNQESRFMELMDMDVHYRDQGDPDGHPVLLLHGTFASLHTWEGWVDHLGDSYRLISVDLPGYGLTGPHPRHDYSMEMYTGFLHSFMHKLGFDGGFSLAGSSLGGLIAWVFERDYPEEVDALILLDAAGYSDSEDDGEPLVFKLGQLPLLRAYFSKATPRWFIEMNLESVYGDDSRITSDLVNRYYYLNRREGNREAVLHSMSQERVDRSAEIQEIEAPTLIQWGELDEWIPVEIGERFHRDIDGSELVVYDGVGHIPMEEAPGISARDAMDFLDGGNLDT